MKKWFENPDNHNRELCEMHRKAYEKSLKSEHAVKVHAGMYYYKGFEISNDGGRECPWNYNRPEASDFDSGYAETKRIAMESIDDLLKDEFTLCDLMCG